MKALMLTDEQLEKVATAVFLARHLYENRAMDWKRKDTETYQQCLEMSESYATLLTLIHQTLYPDKESEF